MKYILSLIFLLILSVSAQAKQNYCKPDNEQSKFIIHIFGESYYNESDKRNETIRSCLRPCMRSRIVELDVDFHTTKTIGTILYLNPRIIVFNGNSKNILKLSDTRGYKFIKVCFTVLH